MNKKTFFGGLFSGLALALAVVICVKTVSAAGVFRSEEEWNVEEKINLIYNLLDYNYVDGVDDESVKEGLYYGMVSSLKDPYTTYMNAEETTSFRETTEGSFFGIGVEVTTDVNTNSILVVAPIADTPAEKAGIKSGDKIIKVNGFDVSGDKLNEAVKMIKGEDGTEVTLTVYREPKGETIEYKLKRSQISIKTVSEELLEDDIGYIKISFFRKNTFNEYEEAVNDLLSKGAKSIIIDVRNNPGGLRDVVGEITDSIVGKGIYVYTIDKNGKKVEYMSDAKKLEVPLAILVNGGSASASEILAGAVQDMGAGKLVGTQTFGKGLIQGLFDLGDGSSLKITIQKYYTPRGVCIQGTGIAPDYVVEEAEDSENDVQLNKAIEVVKEMMH